MTGVVRRTLRPALLLLLSLCTGAASPAPASPAPASRLRGGGVRSPEAAAGSGGSMRAASLSPRRAAGLPGSRRVETRGGAAERGVGVGPAGGRLRRPRPQQTRAAAVMGGEGMATYGGFLPEMKERVGDLLGRGDREFPEDDFTLLRFVRHGRGNLDVAESAYRAMREWRQKTLEEKSFSFPEEPAVRVAYPKGYCGNDREGRPLYIESLGSVDPGELSKVTTVSRLVEAHARDTDRLASEIIPWCQNHLNHTVTGLTAILDLRGISFKQFASSFVQGYIKESIRIDYNYYPSTLTRMFIIVNSGPAEAIWKLGQPWIPKSVKAKIQVLPSSSFPSILREHIDPRFLPQSLGGEREDATFFREERGGWLSQAAPEPKTPSEPTEPMMASEPEFLKTSAEATVLQQKAAVVESAPSEPASTEPTLAEPLALDAPFVEPGVAEKTAEPQKPRRQRWRAALASLVMDTKTSLRRRALLLLTPPASSPNGIRARVRRTLRRLRWSKEGSR